MPPPSPVLQQAPQQHAVPGASAGTAASPASGRSTRQPITAADDRPGIRFAVGVDVGGTKISAGVVDSTGRLHAQIRQPTPRDSAEACQVLLDIIRQLRVDYPLEAVGVGLPGFVDDAGRKLLFAPNLPGWAGLPLADALEREAGLPIVLENDANAAAWGEAAHGAGRGETDLACVTLGTGVGGGLVLNGQLYRGHNGLAGELGHMQVEAGGRPCGCGQRGCWEQYASGQALRVEAQRLSAMRPRAAAQLLAYGDGTAASLQAEHVTLAAAQDDLVAIEAFAAVGHWLGRGLASLSSLLDPSVFILGGGLSHAGDLLLGPARQALREAMPGRTHRAIPELRAAELGNDAGLIGVADLASAGRDTSSRRCGSCP